MAVENVECQDKHKIHFGLRIHFLLRLHIYIFTHSSYKKEHRTTHYKLIFYVNIKGDMGKTLLLMSK
jgi:hypothetical protein